jgi:hypothetical protein
VVPELVKIRAGRSRFFLELSDQKAQDFLVLIALKCLFLKHTRKVFSEMTVRTRTEFWSDFYRQSRTGSCQHLFIFPMCLLTRFRGLIAFL